MEEEGTTMTTNVWDLVKIHETDRRTTNHHPVISRGTFSSFRLESNKQFKMKKNLIVNRVTEIDEKKIIVFSLINRPLSQKYRRQPNPKRHHLLLTSSSFQNVTFLLVFLPWEKIELSSKRCDFANCSAIEWGKL